MLSKRAISALNQAEKQTVHRQWLRSGQCARCFHASIRRRAEKGSKIINDGSTSHNAPKRGPTRHQRAAMISEEVKMLQRARPSPSFGESDPNTLRPSGASQTVDPEAAGQSTVPSRMGANDPASREGPYAQGVGRVNTEDIPAINEPKEVRGTRTPHDGVEEPARGGQRVMDSPAEFEGYEELSRLPQENDSAKVAVAILEPLATGKILNRNPVSTVAGGNFEGAIDERLRVVAEPGQQRDSRLLQALARKMKLGQLVHFESKEEEAAVEAIFNSPTNRTLEATEYEKRGSDLHEVHRGNHMFASLQDPARRLILDKLVAGKYDPESVLAGKQKHKQPLLNDIERMMKKNPTYLSADGDKLLKKVRSLLPAMQTTQPKRKPSSA